MDMHTEDDLKFQILLETAPVAIVVVNREGRVVLVNNATEALFLYERAELLGQPLEILMPERLRRGHAAHRIGFSQEPRVRSMGVGLELVGLKKDGSEFPIEIGLSHVGEGETMQMIAFVTDISARRHAEATQQRLRHELEQYAADLEQRVQERTQEIERRRAVAEGLRDILAVLNSNQPLEDTLRIMVHLAARLLEAPAAVLYESDVRAQLAVVAYHGIEEECVAIWQGKVGIGVVGQAIQRALPIAIGNIEQHPIEDAPIQLMDGTPVRSVLAVPLFVNNAVYGALGLYYGTPHHFSEEEIDLSVSFGRQAALAIENARLRQQVASSAVAAERNRLARELHDAVSQTLFAASITADVLPRVWERSQEMGMARLSDLRQLTRSALAEMRSLLYELRPYVLAKTEMSELLHQLGEGLRGRAQVEVEVIVALSGTLPAEAQMAFYRIAQESTNNIAKHAQAHHVLIALQPVSDSQPDILRLTIQDDGVGFLPHSKSATMLGLEIMRERADDIGADLVIASEPGTGTTITVEWRRSITNGTADSA
jgi:PAS domain S-box-containing protein